MPPDRAEGVVEPDPELPPDDEPLGRTARFAWVAVIVLLVGVIALVVYALTGTPATQAAVRRTPAPTALVASLGHVPQSVFDSVGVDAPDTPLVAPTPLEGQPDPAGGRAARGALRGRPSSARSAPRNGGR